MIVRACRQPDLYRLVMGALVPATLMIAVLGQGLLGQGTIALAQSTATKAESEPAPAAEEAPKKSNASPAPSYGLPQVQKINEEIRQVWADNRIAPSPPATEAEWCRRVYLDVIGRIPSVEELRAFLASRGADRKLTLVNKLLTDEATPTSTPATGRRSGRTP
jgi:hypothetical protein